MQKKPLKIIKERTRPIANVNYGYSLYMERQRNAWSKATKSLPPDAFADDIEFDNDVGHYVPRETHVDGSISSLSDYVSLES